MQLYYLLWLLKIWKADNSEIRAQFHLYQTDHLSEANLQQHDCLYYYVLDDILEYEASYSLVHQIIPYCKRLSTGDKSLSAFESDGELFTFDQLFKQNITSAQLYRWSAPVDLAERYQVFLDTQDSRMSSHLFYNCSWPLFGQYCQYYLDIERANISFGAAVKTSFLNKELISGEADLLEVTTPSCYTFVACHRERQVVCLDWRDICDGKIDCLDEETDEIGCFALEGTDCAPNEYRCHNGLCIPANFLADDPLNPECLDGTDEYLIGRLIESFDWSHGPTQCYQDPAFRCEDRACRQFRQHSCGDGSCSMIPFAFDANQCINKRHELFRESIFSRNSNLILPVACWFAMSCLTRYYRTECVRTPCYSPHRNCSDFIRENCPLFYLYPTMPLIHGHVYWGYSSNHSVFCSKDHPEFVCYNHQLCDSLPVTLHIGNLSCSRLEELKLRDKYLFKIDLINVMQRIFGRCLFPKAEATDHRNASLFQCKNSSKMISNSRLFDSIVDCPDGSDEALANSSACSLYAASQYVCRIADNITKCISSDRLRDKIVDCPYGDDESLPIESVKEERTAFGRLCDTFIDIPPRWNDSESDETNCEHWPCNNQFTRCDGFWHCRNGADEVDCPDNVCSAVGHQCFSPFDRKLFCLPTSRADDGVVDCLGGTDEREYCRVQHPHDPLLRYRCWNETRCLSTDVLCNDFFILP